MSGDELSLMVDVFGNGDGDGDGPGRVEYDWVYGGCRL